MVTLTRHTGTNVRRFPVLLAAAAGAALAAPAIAGDIATGFNYPSFFDTDTLSLVGAASTIPMGKGQQPMALTPSSGRQAGAMWHGTKVNVTAGWESTFQISVDNVNGLGADGFAFVIQNQSATALGGDGGGLGYGVNPMFGGAGITHSLAVEFDMWNNAPANWTDLDDNHVAIQSLGTQANTPVHGLATLASQSLSTLDSPINLNNGAVHTIVISYTPNLDLGIVGGSLSVFVNDLVNPVLQTTVNLAALLGLEDGAAWIGITSATGNALDAQRHLVHNWAYSSVIPGPGTVSLLGLAGVMAARRRRSAQ